MEQPIIRTEHITDRSAIAVVLNDAFGRDDEVKLVDDLHHDGDALLGLVAEIDGVVVGYILFSRVVIDTLHGPRSAATLAPLAVDPGFQGRGIGTSLTEAGLRMLQDAGESIVFVIGEPDYYRCFDFSSDAARAFTCPWSEEAGDAHMVLATPPHLLSGLTGTVRYPRAFNRFIAAPGDGQPAR